MPTYEFRCPEGHDFEKFYRTISSAESQAVCPQCGKLAERIMSPTGFAFKGSGFYLTDYGKNAHRDRGSDAKPAASTNGTKPETKSDAASGTGTSTPAPASTSSDAKPAAKADAKAATPPAKKSSAE